MAKLYVVATPIGNLGDLSPRALEILKKSDLIAAEDTRTAMKLCQVFDIHTKLTSIHQHNEKSKGEYLAEKMLLEDLQIALTTDAGTPCISDPGYYLICECYKRDIEVIPIPGCCAAIAALSICGFDTREFSFLGFLPREKKLMSEKLRSVNSSAKIAVVHESPFRIINLVQCIEETLPGAEIAVCCDLTKMHEKTIRGEAKVVLQQLKNNPKTEKGEYCIVIDMHNVSVPDTNNPQTNTIYSLEAQIVELMKQGMNCREAQEQLILNGEKKNAVKQAALCLKRMMEIR